MFEKTENKQERGRGWPNFNKKLEDYFKVECAVVVAQLVERSLPTPEGRGSSPVVSKMYIEDLLTV